MTSHSVETTTHGRVLVENAADPHSGRLLVACHGYAQNADAMLEEVRRIPGVAGWRVASVQALHRFYSRSQQTVVASWMTRENRDLAIADNIAYLDRAVEAAGGNEAGAIVFLGFSQGAAMAYRAALCGRYQAAGVVALAGDVPPDVKALTPRRWPRVLLGGGMQDSWYTAGMLAADEQFLASRDVERQIVRFDGGHDWTDAFRLAAGRWLEAFSR